MEDKPNYYAVIPANVRYDNELKANEKLLYGEITTLTSKTGSCWASNTYFSSLYNVKPNAIATWIRHLKEKKYIEIDYQYKDNTKEIQQRIIKIGGIQKDTTSYPKEYEGGIQKDTHNNTSNTNNTSKKEIYKERFKKPTLDEVKEYCLERQNGIDAQYFIDYYTKIGWVYGKNKIPIKDWKACIRTWERNRKPYEVQTEELPDWFDKKIEKKETDDETKRLIAEIEGTPTNNN